MKTRAYGIACGLILAAAVRAMGADLVDERFPAAPDAAWKLERRATSTPSIEWPPKEAGALRFASEGMDFLTRACAVGAGPFEFRADIDLTEGTLIGFPRFNGLAVCLTPEPPEKMAKGGMSVIFAVHQHGATAAVGRGTFGGYEKQPNSWQIDFADASPRFKTTNGGAGGVWQSVSWPNQSLAGMKLRFHAERRADQTVKFTIYNGDCAAGSPWWDAETRIPKDLQNVELKYLTIRTMRNPDDYADLGRRIQGKDAQVGKTRTAGIVRRVAVRQLGAGEKPALAEPFPPAVLPAKAKPAEYRSMSLDRGATLDSLRRKFNAPAFADYKAVILKHAEPDSLAQAKMNSPAQGDRVIAVLWPYVLTGEAKYRTALLAELDALIGPTDTLPQETSGHPGHLHQQLDIKEFMGHNTAALAIAYDLLGNDLDQARRDRIRYLLVRSVRNYLDRIEKGDWWYLNNPSNTIAVGNGTMGLCAVALRDDDPELSRKAMDTAIASIKKAYIAIRPDGGCIEGNLYWDYALGWQLRFGHAVRSTTGDDHGLLTQEGLKNAYRYVENNLGGDGNLIPFNDTQPWLKGAVVCAHAGAEFNNVLMRWMADKMIRESARWPHETFLYRDEVAAPAAFPGVPTLSTLASIQEGVMRSDGKAFVPGLVTGVKGKGELSTHHAQQDQGSFVVYANGEAMLIDPGYYQPAPNSHSLPVIGEVKTMKLHPNAVCPLSEAWESGTIRSMAVDATPAYNTGVNEKAPLATRARRVFVQVADIGAVVLDDTVPADAKAPITVHYQAGFPAEAKDAAATVTGKNGTLSLTTFGPALKLSVAERDFGDSWIYAKRGVPWRTISGTYAMDVAKPLITVLAPAKTGATPAAAKVDYAQDRLTVTLGPTAIGFTKDAGGWHAARP